ncbi:hypothetical protein F511_34009 [Dorcoceras hygrometricum]|uniref:Uncharacterized protein n=1 Tax=Dorcoceras hygrometricum TaxID=472368 RepID=A0A2Z7AUS2_9LAMI|nr:hypothetical protein F511_34009 [Dorcoceras hygrometricum]
MHETQKPLNDKSGLGFSVGESISGETSTQSDLAGDKFKKMNFVKASVTHDSYESVKYDDQTTGKLNHKGKSDIQAGQGSNPIGSDLRWNRNHPPEQIVGVPWRIRIPSPDEAAEE